MSVSTTKARGNSGKHLITQKLLDAAALRFSNLCLVFMIGFGFFGFFSYETFVKFMPDLTLWDNVWPRLLLNSLPFLILHFAIKNPKTDAFVRCMIGAIGVPIVFTLACSIHAWPIMWNGKTEFYLYVHGANVFVITISILSISPPKKILISYMSCYTLFFALPLVVIFLHTQASSVLKLFVGDMVIFMPAIFAMA